MKRELGVVNALSSLMKKRDHNLEVVDGVWDEF